MLIPYKGVLTSCLLAIGVITSYGQEIVNPYDTIVAKGEAAVKAGELEPAKDFFYAALEMVPEGVVPNYMLGYCYAQDCLTSAENCDISIRFLDKAIRKDKSFLSPFYYRALSKFTQGDLTGALADVDTQIEINSKDPALFLLRARIYHQLDNKEGACADLNWVKDTQVYLSTPKEILTVLEAYCRE